MASHNFNFGLLSEESIGGPNPNREQALQMILDQAKNKPTFKHKRQSLPAKTVRKLANVTPVGAIQLRLQDQLEFSGVR